MSTITPQALARMKEAYFAFKAQLDAAGTALDAGDNELFYLEMISFIEAMSVAGAAFNKAASERSSKTMN